METNSNDYRISFFKPTTPIARHNRNIVIWLVCIWAVAIFGFQILLRVVQKPTPEPAYNLFEATWPAINQGDPAAADLENFARTNLSVLAKNFINPDERKILQNSLSWAVYSLTPAEGKQAMISSVEDFEKLRKEITSISDPAYIEQKSGLESTVSQILRLAGNDVRRKVIGIELSSEAMNENKPSDMGSIPGIMGKYLIHNQSFLTDFKFLGFPFHYFYTAIFLLVLFVGLCWLYCIRIDRRNRILGIQD
jgi:putative solute:sodium symporter small subunit